MKKSRSSIIGVTGRIKKLSDLLLREVLTLIAILLPDKIARISVCLQEKVLVKSLQAFEKESVSGDTVYQEFLLQILVTLFNFLWSQINCFCLPVKSHATKSK